jgi:hypothetical protein
MSEATYKKITLNGEIEVLKYDFNAISELEMYYDKGIHGIVNEEVMGFNTVRNFLWAGMLWKNPNIKTYHVGKMLEREVEENDDFDFEQTLETAVEALYSSKAFKLLSKNTKTSEQKVDKKVSKKEKN